MNNKTKIFFSVLIVLYHSPLHIIKSNIIRINYKNIEYILIDNSVDVKYYNSVKKWINEDIPKFRSNKIKLLKSIKNLGYSGGNNLGFIISEGDYILILNPDMELEDDFFIKAERIIREKRWEIISPKIYNSFESKKLVCGLITFRKSSLTYLGKKINYYKEDKNVSRCYYTFYAHGGCFLIKRSVFEELNGFDENFFMYTEEVDLCYRAKKKNYKVIYCPLLKSAHKKQKDSIFAHKMMLENEIYFVAKHFSFLLLLLKIFFSFIRFFIIIIDLQERKIQYKAIKILLYSIFRGLNRSLNLRIKN